MHRRFPLLRSDSVSMPIVQNEPGSREVKRVILVKCGKKIKTSFHWASGEIVGRKGPK